MTPFDAESPFLAEVMPIMEQLREACIRENLAMVAVVNYAFDGESASYGRVFNDRSGSMPPHLATMLNIE